MKNLRKTEDEFAYSPIGFDFKGQIYNTTIYFY